MACFLFKYQTVYFNALSMPNTSLSRCYSSARVLMSIVAGCEACVRLAGNRVHVCRYGAVLCALVRYEGMTEWQTGVNRGVRLSGMPPSAFLFALRTSTASSVRITYRFIDTKLVWFTFKLKAIDNVVEKQSPLSSPINDTPELVCLIASFCGSCANRGETS